MKIITSMIIMSTIGAITDVAISITSPMREVFLHHPTITRKQLFLSGMSIGKDILGSNTNTLFFAFIGGYIGLLLWFRDLSYSIGGNLEFKSLYWRNSCYFFCWYWYCTYYSHCFHDEFILFSEKTK